MILRSLLALATTPAFAVAGVLYSTRFETDLPSLAASASPASLRGDHALPAEGTIDTYRGPRTPALTLRANLIGAPAGATLALHAGPVAIANTETNLARLTLGFDLWSATIRPVRVRIESCDPEGKPTGARTILFNPPVAGAFYRFGIDLDRTEPVAGGTFDPLAPSIRFSFEVADPDAPTPLPRVAGDILRIDNLSYTAPSFFVSPTGDDSAAGSEAAPFATLQHAVDRAQPGDVIFLLDGTHAAPPEQMLARIAKAGAPDRWIVLRSHPGHHPVLTGEGWNVIGLDHASAYIELRDLVVRGQRKKFTVEQALADTKSGQPADPKFNTNGLALDARKGREDGGKAHHIRFIRCTVSDVPGGGLSAIAGDHITLEGNVVQDNAHLMRCAGSGTSVFRAWE
ncbi:MAG: hypothetical protein H7067_09115, partial [Burkholderiales bacterium]|nr:hypothetical protein [Opitutaceae bacterium]